MIGKDIIPDYDIWNALSDSLPELVRIIRLVVEEKATAHGHVICSIKTIHQKPLPDEVICFCIMCPFEVSIIISDELDFNGDIIKDECPNQSHRK